MPGVREISKRGSCGRGTQSQRLLDVLDGKAGDGHEAGREISRVAGHGALQTVALGLQLQAFAGHRARRHLGARQLDHDTASVPAAEYGSVVAALEDSGAAAVVVGEQQGGGSSTGE